MGRGICAIATLIAVAALASGCALDQWRSFGPAGRAEIPSARLFDLGVADFDEDGRLDIFTVNHKFAGAWLRNEGAKFTDVTAAIGADPDPQFPGLDRLRAPRMDEPGVYVYLTDSEEGEPGLLHIRAVGTEAAGKVGFLSTSLRVERAHRARIRLGINEQSVRVVKFRARPGAAIVLNPSSVADAPMAAFFSEPADPGSIRVGAGAVSPETTDFRLTLRDRHAIAFANLVGDDAIESTPSWPAAASAAASPSPRSGDGSATSSSSAPATATASSATTPASARASAAAARPPRSTSTATGAATSPSPAWGSRGCSPGRPSGGGSSPSRRRRRPGPRSAGSRSTRARRRCSSPMRAS
jgi:hypothetical protein